MSTLTVGGGGREHAMMLAFQQDGLEQMSTQANAGMELLGPNLGIKPKEVDAITAAAVEREVGFVVVGPEAPLIAGLANRLRNRGIPTLGFNQAGARLEGSKGYATGFMQEFGILLPESSVASSVDEAKRFIAGRPATDIVLKADGEAGGKGVILPDTTEEANQVIEDMMSGKLFGEAGEQVVIQERLTGPEVSMFALFDGKKAKILYLAQDHKRLRDNDEGPNTGGMGAYSPVPPTIVSEAQIAKMYEALERTMDGMQQRGIATPGILYFGFKLAEEYGGDPALLEYNVRLGDPEAQVVLARLIDAGVDVHELFYQTARGALEGDRISTIQQQSDKAALTVCLAANGYPGTPDPDDVIHGLDQHYPNVILHHGGTRRRPDNKIVTAGGRVLYVTALGETLDEAAAAAYRAIGPDAVHFARMQYRKGIGRLALAA